MLNVLFSVSCQSLGKPGSGKRQTAPLRYSKCLFRAPRPAAAQRVRPAAATLASSSRVGFG
eukprot:scaffold231795_cov30-Tisochrysis_lutea.AAC.2